MQDEYRYIRRSRPAIPFQREQGVGKRTERFNRDRRSPSDGVSARERTSFYALVVADKKNAAKCRFAPGHSYYYQHQNEEWKRNVTRRSKLRNAQEALLSLTHQECAAALHDLRGLPPTVIPRFKKSLPRPMFCCPECFTPEEVNEFAAKGQRWKDTMKRNVERGAPNSDMFGENLGSNHQSVLS